MVRVDAATLGGWVGWRYAGAEHVAAPVDVCRRGGGHDALLPWCTDRVLGFLVRRAATGAGLVPGECCTLAISLLRGIDEVGEGLEGTRSGGWWLTDGGRPVFVFGEGADIREGAVEILGRLAADSRDKVLTRALRAVEQGLSNAVAQPRVPRKLLDAWERDLLIVAAPQPLERGAHPPERASGVARAVGWQTSDPPRNRQRLRADRGRSDDRRGIAPGIRALGDAAQTFAGVQLSRVREFGRAAASSRAASGRASSGQAAEGGGAGEFRGAEEVGGAATGLRSATTGRGGDARSRGLRRRRSILVAGAAAAVVLAAGLLWPGGGASGEPAGPGESARTRAPSPGRDPVASKGSDTAANAEPEDAPATSAQPTTESVPPTDESPSAAAVGLLETIADCRAAGDSSCAEGVAAGSTGVVDALETVEQSTPAIELVDEYGDVAVLSLGLDDAQEEIGSDVPGRLMLVLIRTDEKWLVRDVYDVADQPG